MSVLLRCPYCLTLNKTELLGRNENVNQYLNKDVRCSACEATFRVKVTIVKAEDDR